MPGFLRRLLYVLRHSRQEQELHEEMETHRLLRQANLEAEGLSTAEADVRSRRALGNVTLAREESRAAWIPFGLQQLKQDVRYALRDLRRSPGFNLAAISMLTFGMGLVAGGYGVFNGLTNRGWDVPDPETVFVAHAWRPAPNTAENIGDGFSLAAYEHVRANARAARYVVSRENYFRLRAEAVDDNRLTGSSAGGNFIGERQFMGSFVSDNFIDVLDIPIQRGTGNLAPKTGEPPAIVISDTVWRRLFGADPAVVGRTAWVNDVPVVVSGVTAREFSGLQGNPLGVMADIRFAAVLGGESAADGTSCCVEVSGRMWPGRTHTTVEAELRVLIDQYRHSIRQPALTVAVTGTTLADMAGGGMHSDRWTSVATSLALIAAGFVLVFLLTCANVGNLYLARSFRREREIAMRLALGASRARVIRQLLTEGLVTASVAGTGAFGVASVVPVIPRLVEDSVTAHMLAADWRVAAFAAAAVIVTCLLVSLAPALQITRITWRGAAPTLSAPIGRMRGVLLGVQVAIAVVLVASATLLGRGMIQATNVRTDFAIDTTTLIELWDEGGPAAMRRIDPQKPSQDTRGSDLAGQALLAGAESHGFRMGLANVFIGRDGLNSMWSAVRPWGSDVEYRSNLVPLSSEAAAVLELALVSGRWTSDDSRLTEAVVNETLAEDLWPGRSALGQALTLSFDKRIYTVVGVTRDAHLTKLHGAVDPIVHIAPAPNRDLPVVLLARSDVRLEPAVRAIVGAIAPQVDIRLTPLRESARPREEAAIGAGIAGALGFVALALASLGVFSAFSYLVEIRRREIGIRLALGASKRQIRDALFRATSAATAGGAVAGLGLSALAGMALRRFLFGMSPADPISYLVVAAIIATAALTATAIPVRRAVRVDPARTLRAD